MMKSKQRQVLKLEAELLRLNALVRQRRKQLAYLEKCPNKDCECRRVWHQVVERNLAQQMGRLSEHVRDGTPGKPRKPKVKMSRTK